MTSSIVKSWTDKPAFHPAPHEATSSGNILGGPQQTRWCNPNVNHQFTKLQYRNLNVHHILKKDERPNHIIGKTTSHSSSKLDDPAWKILANERNSRNWDCIDRGCGFAPASCQPRHACEAAVISRPKEFRNLLARNCELTRRHIMWRVRH